MYRRYQALLPSLLAELLAGLASFETLRGRVLIADSENLLVKPVIEAFSSNALRMMALLRIS
jgi:hypothetical protein